MAGALAVPGGMSLQHSACGDCSGAAGATNPKLGHSSAGGALGPVVIEASSRAIDIVVIVWVGKGVVNLGKTRAQHVARRVPSLTLWPPQSATISQN